MVFFRPFCYNKKEAECNCPAPAAESGDTYPVCRINGDQQGGESMKSGLVKVSDGAHIYYEMEGSGRPVVLILAGAVPAGFIKRTWRG